MEALSSAYADVAFQSQDTNWCPEVAGEVEIDTYNANSPYIPLSNSSVPRKDDAVVHHDHDYTYDSMRYIMLAEKMLEMEERETQMKQQLRRKSKTISKKQATIKCLRKQVNELKLLVHKETSAITDPILLELQANKLRKSRGARYSDCMKNLALVLHYCSTKAYKQMRQVFALPSISTIRKWLAKIDVGEGFSQTVLNLLKLKADTLPLDEKLVTIFFDEMAITEKITYFGNAKVDYFSGYPTKLPSSTYVNTSVRAKSALVVMIKSIKSGFKQAIGYFFVGISKVRI